MSEKLVITVRQKQTIGVIVILFAAFLTFLVFASNLSNCSNAFAREQSGEYYYPKLAEQCSSAFPFFGFNFIMILVGIALVFVNHKILNKILLAIGLIYLVVMLFLLLAPGPL